MRGASSVGWIVLLVATGLQGCSAPPPAIPQPQTAEMGAMVASVLGEARQGVVDDDGSADAWGRFGAACHAHGLVDEAVTCYARAHELAPGEFHWAYLLAVAAAERGDERDEVDSLLKQAERIRSDYATLHVRRGRLSLVGGGYREAEKAFRHALDLEPESATALLGLGQALVALDESAQAVETLERAAELAPKNGAVYAALAGAYAKLGRPEAAEGAARRGRHLGPASGIADPLFDEHVTSMGASARHWFARGRARIEAGQFTEAIPELELVLRERADDADTLYLLARAYVGLGDRGTARDHLTRAVAVKPDHVPARLLLARILIDQKDVAAALEELKLARAVAPDDPALLDELARISIGQGDLDAAITDYERIAELIPDDARIRANLGTLHVRRNDLQRAVAQFEAALEIDPDYVNAHHRLGLVLDRLGRKAEAQQHYAHVVRLDPDHPARERLQR